MASSFVGRIGVVDFQRNTGGWVNCSDLADRDSSACGHLFWVPETCRKALCSKETLAVYNKHTTRLDLDQFAHGTSWTQCYDPQASVPVHLSSSTDDISSGSPRYPSLADNSIISSLPISKESPSDSDDCPSLSKATPPSLPMSATDDCINSVEQVANSPPASDQSVWSYTHHFQNIAIVLIPVLTICYFRTIGGSK